MPCRFFRERYQIVEGQTEEESAMIDFFKQKDCRLQRSYLFVCHQCHGVAALGNRTLPDRHVDNYHREDDAAVECLDASGPLLNLYNEAQWLP